MFFEIGIHYSNKIQTQFVVCTLQKVRYLFDYVTMLCDKKLQLHIGLCDSHIKWILWKSEKICDNVKKYVSKMTMWLDHMFDYEV